MTTRLLILLLTCWTISIIGSPADDLSSPSQDVRDAAAKVLRSSFTAPSRTNWEAVVNSITNGMTKTNLLKLLAPYHVTPLMGMGSGGSHSQTYRLDDAWILVCWFRNQGDVLFERTLSASLRYVWVAPPTNFTGIWITYSVMDRRATRFITRPGSITGSSSHTALVAQSAMFSIMTITLPKARTRVTSRRVAPIITAFTREGSRSTRGLGITRTAR